MRDKQIEENTYNTHKRLYKVWINMKQRCYNPKHNSYYGYGGRGITICDEWKNDFMSIITKTSKEKTNISVRD